MKSKKPLYLVLACLVPIILVFILASCNSFSETEYAVVGEGLTFDIYTYDQYENSTVRITGIETMPAHLIIPEKINGMTVVEIGEGAFADNDILLYLEFPKGSIKLGNGFCSGSLALTGINLSGSVSVIPDNAFEDCPNLALIDGMDGVSAIGQQAFAGCSALSFLDIPETLTAVGAEAFRGCTSLARIRIPSAVTSIGESAFWGCEALAVAELLCTADIPQYCFLGCTSLTSVKIDDSVTSIKEEAFRNCRALYSVEFGKGCKEIGDYAFHGCDLLTDIAFSDKSGVSIGEGNEALNGQIKEEE